MVNEHPPVRSLDNARVFVVLEVVEAADPHVAEDVKASLLMSIKIYLKLIIHKLCHTSV